MAWDRRLLTRTQHLTLLISNLRRVWPVLLPDGSMSRSSNFKEAHPRFKVGLTRGYKPTNKVAIETTREFISTQDEERLSSEKPKFMDSNPSSSLMDAKKEGNAAKGTEEDPEDEHFQSFSLSAPLESLLNHQLLLLLQLRLEHDLGWAGAELLLWEAERLQEKPGKLYNGLRTVSSHPCGNKSS